MNGYFQIKIVTLFLSDTPCFHGILQVRFAKLECLLVLCFTGKREFLPFLNKVMVNRPRAASVRGLFFCQ